MKISILSALQCRLNSLKRDERGVSAVEFAMILPLMITLYLGTVEISQGVAINRKVTLTARTVADLGSQASSISSGDMTNLLNASAAVIAPFSAGPLKVTVTQIRVDQNSIAKVEWSCTLNGTKRAKDSTVSIPTALKVPNTYLIWGEVDYNYVPTIGYVVTGSLNLKDQIYMRPRLSEMVNGATAC